MSILSASDRACNGSRWQVYPRQGCRCQDGARAGHACRQAGSGGYAGADRGQQGRGSRKLVSSVVEAAVRLCVRSGAGGKLPDLANAAGFGFMVPQADMSVMMPVLTSMLGLAGMRSYEKVKQVTK